MSQSESVALNDVVDIIAFLKDDRFRELVNASAVKADCGTRCGCNDSMCGCRGKVQKIAEEGMLPSELEQLKQRRMLELRQQIQDVEAEISATESLSKEPAKPTGK